MALQTQQSIAEKLTPKSKPDDKKSFKFEQTSPLREYRDDNEPTPGDTFQEVPDEDIHIQEKARLEFGLKLATLIGIKGLSIKVASSLPPSLASNNAFRDSYFFREEDNTLLVHTNRVSSSGDFGLVVIHGLSHIKVWLDMYLQCLS